MTLSNDTDRLFDEYLDALLQGQMPKPEEFLQKHGKAGEELLQRLEAMYEVMHASNGHKQVPARQEGEAGLPFERLGEYRLLRKLGGGGMGMVFLAEQESLDRMVALKVIRPEYLHSPTAIERFHREARALAKLQHPNIVTIYGFGEHQGSHFIAMELVPGQSLREVLAETGSKQLDARQTIRWIFQIAEALHCIHEAGLLHRDIKPSNIRITAEGQAILVDFGLAKRVGSPVGLTLTESFTGSPAYASPEQIKNAQDLDARTDVYSLGITLYQCLTGQPPYQAESMNAIFHQILNTDPPAPRTLLPSLARDVEIVTLKAMEKERAQRYASARNFAEDLKALLEFHPIQARSPGKIRLITKWIRRHRGAAAALLTAILAATAILVFNIVQARIDHLEKVRNAEQFVAEARQKVRSYDIARGNLENDERKVRAMFDNFQSQFVPESEVDALNQLEGQVRTAKLQREKLVYEVEELLRSAERLYSKVAGLNQVRAELYLARLHEAFEVSDYAAAKFFEQELDRVDDGTLRKKAFPYARIKLLPYPAADLDVYIFKIVSLAEIYPGGEPREVFVPVGDWQPPLPPGTWALRVTEPSGTMRENDLILEIGGYPVEANVLVAKGNDEVQRLDRLVSVNDIPVKDNYSLRLCPLPFKPETGIVPEDRKFAFERGEELYTIYTPGLRNIDVEAKEMDDLARQGGFAAKVFQNGTIKEIILPEGLDVRVTGRPLWIAPSNRRKMSASTPWEKLQPGRYLFLIRKEGFEDIRLPVIAYRGTKQEFSITLIPEGTSPPEFIPIQHRHPHSDSSVFWVMDREITCAEYLKYLNSPSAQKDIASSEKLVRVPRSGTNPFWKSDGESRYAIPEGFRPQWPIIGLSFEDVLAYVEWRTRQARQKGLPYTYYLPTESDYNHFLSGGGSGFSYGELFRPAWSNTCFSQVKPTIEAVLSYPIDETVTGVYDLCGSSLEFWAEYWDDDKTFHRASGGAWGEGGPKNNHIFGGFGLRPGNATGQTGVRLFLQISGFNQE